MYHKQTPTHGEYHYKQYMQVCALYKPQARLCLLASDNLPAKRCIWQAQNGDPTRVCRHSKTPDKYGDTQASAWSRALATAWSRACCAIAIMASNT